VKPSVQRLHERDKLVFFLIGQAEITDGHIDIVRNLGLRPAVDFLDRFRPGSVRIE